MAVPAFLNSSWNYTCLEGVDDVQDIMDQFATDAAAKSWTNPSAGLYQSPTDGDGRFFDVLLTRSTQQKLEFRVRDQSANTIVTRRINCPSTNTWTARIYIGQYHAVIDCTMHSAAPEAVGGGILDLSPEAQSAHSKYVFGFGYRSNTDVAGTNTNFYAGMIDNVTVTIAQRATRYGNSGSASNAPFKQTSDERIWRPQSLFVAPTGTATMSYAGRVYQCLISYDDMQQGTEFTVPIDTGTTAKFTVANGWVASSTQHQMVAFRSG